MRVLLCLFFLFTFPPLLFAQTSPFSRVAREVETDLKKAQTEETLTLADVAEKRKGLMARRDHLRADIKRESEALAADELRLSEMRKKTAGTDPFGSDPHGPHERAGRGHTGLCP